MGSLNVWNSGWLPLTCFRNLVDNIKNIATNVKHSYQRITRGYCDYDVWELNTYYDELLSATLLHLRDTTHGYPADMSEEGWYDWLTKAAKCFHDGNSENNAFENIYKEDAIKLYDKWTVENGQLVANYTEDEKALNELFIRQENENEKLRNQCIDNGLKMLSERWQSLWD